MTGGGCRLCPRECGVDRTAMLGWCGQSDKIKIARAAPHMWEEPCISGSNGSGTVFFCGCTLGCVYCQNYAISRCGESDKGTVVSVERLAEIFLELQEKGVHNINLVTPTMFAPSVAMAIDVSRERGLAIPIVYNTSGYESERGIAAIADKIDIYLPDFKYISSDVAKGYSHAEDYPTHAKASLKYMTEQIGTVQFDADGMMTRGVIVRHLLLPGQLAESKRVLEYLFSEYENRIYYSIMSQYTPVSALDTDKFPELNRRVTTYEYQKLIEHAMALGITNGFMQDGSAAKESFIPQFGTVK